MNTINVEMSVADQLKQFRLSLGWEWEQCRQKLDEDMQEKLRAQYQRDLNELEATRLHHEDMIRRFEQSRVILERQQADEMRIYEAQLMCEKADELGQFENSLWRKLADMEHRLLHNTQQPAVPTVQIVKERHCHCGRHYTAANDRSLTNTDHQHVEESVDDGVIPDIAPLNDEDVFEEEEEVPEESHDHSFGSAVTDLVSDEEEEDEEEEKDEEAAEQEELEAALKAVAIRDRIDELRKENEESTTLGLRFNRQCAICYSDSPLQRAVFSSCGHVICLACAVDINKMVSEDSEDDELELKCPLCNGIGGFVKLIESPIEKKDMCI